MGVSIAKKKHTAIFEYQISVGKMFCSIPLLIELSNLSRTLSIFCFVFLIKKLFPACDDDGGVD